MAVISGRALGRRQPLFADWSVEFPPEFRSGGGATLRDVIARVVRDEVRAFRDRQDERRVFRALTAREIETGAAAGKIEAGGREGPPQPVDEEDAVGTALQAFEDGLYLVVIDDAEQRSLDAPVFVQPDSRITFVRLTLLAGG